MVKSFASARLILAILVALSGVPLFAVEQITLQLDGLFAETWQVKNAQVNWRITNKDAGDLSIRFDSLTLPMIGLRLIQGSLDCDLSQTNPGELNCRNGVARFDRGLLASAPAAFDLVCRKSGYEITLRHLAIANGTADIMATVVNDQWTIVLDAEKINLGILQGQDVFRDLILPTNAVFGVKGRFTGENGALAGANFVYEVEQLSGDYQSGTLAFENLKNSGTVSLERDRLANYEIDLTSRFDGGNFYAEPVLLDFDVNTLKLKAAIVLSPDISSVFFSHVEVEQDKVFHLSAQGEKQADLSLQAKLNVLDYSRFYPVFIDPFLYGSALQGLNIQGQSQTAVTVKQGEVTALESQVSAITLSDPADRFSLEKLEGRINWNKEAVAQPSYLKWHAASLYKIPLEATQLPFLLKPEALALTRPVSVGLLAGSLLINQFSANWTVPESPVFDFKGNLNNLSLGKLAEALQWSPVDGEISGVIPKVSYQNEQLLVDGALEIQVFDGQFVIDELKITHLFGVLPRMQGDIAFSNLDLAKLTRHFSIGHIEGTLEGYLNQLVLENWQPVSFRAWFGSPEKDAAQHVISQKAVENLTSLGGGSAADILSRGFIGFFDEFNYDKIGVGCALSRGVCQLSGVAPAETGYFIVKGRGIPRINVIGYNQQVDWSVLLSRLQRITRSDSAIVE